MRRRKVVVLITADEKVSIPKCLIDALKPFGARFIKVCAPIVGDAKSGKKAVENGWLERRYEADDIELSTWLEGGGNYGIVCGEGLHAIDLDDKLLQEKFEQYIETLTVKTGRTPEGRHYLLRSDCTENGIIFSNADKDGNRKNLGNIQVKNKYVVGAGCFHYSGKKYEIAKDVPIAWITKKDLEEIFGENLAWSKQRLSEEQAQIEMNFGFDIPIADVIDLTMLRQIGENEFQGAHPIHGSEGGNNFTVNTRKNCWHCFRCNSGGGALSWLAVKRKIIECHEAQKGNLKGEIFKKVLAVAKKDGFEIDIGKDEELTSEVAKYFDNKKFVAAYLATELMEKFHYVTRKTDEMIFVYHPKHGTYTPDGNSHLKTHTRKALGKYLTKYRLSEVINFVVCSTLKDTNTTPPHLILVKNGILNVTTGKLEDFSPDYFILNVVPVRYDPNAKISAIEKFVKEIVHPDDVPVLQETAGYCLWREYMIQVAVMLIGEGANGKSTWIELLRTFLGDENVSSESLQSFEANRFSLGGLFGKLANLYPDLSNRALDKTGTFKMLTGGDTVSAEHKFRARFYFKNYAKLIFSANKIPESKDDTTAFFRRWIIINFPNQFLADNPKTDPQLLKKLTTEVELSGFLNWCLEGLRRLIENKKFSRSKSIEETREQYLRSSDPVKAFAMDKLEYKAGSAIPKTEVYKAFIEYCQKMKLPTVSQTTFASKLVECMPTTKTTRKRIEGSITACWVDLAMEGVSGVSVVQGISTKVTTEKLDKYKESRDLIEKGCTTDTTVTEESFEEALKGGK